jgi:hypothetical protein
MIDTCSLFPMLGKSPALYIVLHIVYLEHHIKSQCLFQQT